MILRYEGPRAETEIGVTRQVVERYGTVELPEELAKRLLEGQPKRWSKATTTAAAKRRAPLAPRAGDTEGGT